MKLSVDITGDKNLIRTLRKISEKDLKKNVPRALNYAAKKEQVQIRKKVKSNISNLKVRFLNQRIKVFRANRVDWSAAIFISAAKIPLEYLNFRERKGGSVYRLGAQKKIAKKAFLVKRVKGVSLSKPVVFERVRKPSYPIRRAFEASLATIVKRKKIIVGSQKRMLKLFLKELRRLNKLDV